MSTTPLFLSAEDSRASLIQVDRALESMREAGYELTAAAGEPLDNSIEANATILRVMPVYTADRKAIEEILFADNGTGIDPAILHHVLSMGYSSRYGQRRGLGRFGVGLKLAALNMGERLDVYTKRAGDARIYHTYIDLQEIKAGRQHFITSTTVEDWPVNGRTLMLDRKGNPFSSGTLVVFGKIDRLENGRTYDTSLQAKISELRRFIARAYRKFIDAGRVFELEGRTISLHDPLFLMDNPRIINKYKPLDVRGVLVQEGDVEVDGHKVRVTVTLVPKEFRPQRGEGGARDLHGHDIGEFYINDENAGRISFLRNGREIYYDVVPRMLPGGRTDKVNRYIGIEVSFPAELDEFFQVRHVKRGAEPVGKLREQLRKWLERPIKQARKEIRAYWDQVDTGKRQEEIGHADSMKIAAHVEARFPAVMAHQNLAPEKEREIIRQAISDLQLDPNNPEDRPRIDQILAEFDSKPVVLLDGQWFGKELMEVRHLNGRSVAVLNHRHPFFRDVYAPFKQIADNGAGHLTREAVVDLARQAEAAIDLLLMAFVRAEASQPDPDAFENLRSYWGMFAQEYLKEQIGN
ncbi:ATP-binding protein [Streptomyces aidingensis]|uniref:Histidine kinase-, DNA gyrase B-, and HSP90-like ATPase n=1 Tax=Streptomyces aidingensis TaxID=910347 RepID=A0A1I1KH27_9ACTN|nr:ATP-binding protein [Streptomyces aidingensis]SFC60119.1 Histidine kinase-, DNA gyrase B-, and HSP90-like ATPase [Streptomyces aidingensis]